MSSKKAGIFKGFAADFISRIERCECVGQPKSKRYIICMGKSYASDAAKQTGDAFGDFSRDLASPEIDAAIDALIAACYAEMKKAGGLFEGSTDV